MDKIKIVRIHNSILLSRSFEYRPSDDASDISPTIWRYFPTLDPQVEVFLSRDLDSRITEREVAAVQEWLHSDKVHIPASTL